MLEEDALSTSFFEPSQFQSASPEIPEVSQSASFTTDSLNNINPWDPPQLDFSTTPDVLLPDVYNSAFAQASPVAGTVPISALTKILSISGLPHATIEKIINLAAAANSVRVNRGEFNVALALVALAQKNMDVSIETLIERKNDLPEPILTNLENLNFNRDLNSFSASRPTSMPLQADDPWAMPSAHSSNPSYSSQPNFPINNNAGAPAIITTMPNEDEFQWFLDADLITVKIAPEKDGFLFKHVNYILESQRHQTKVIRRYSDFWWLMECLVKKYPYRILPDLPPKKIGVNGFYFTVDESFLEKRRKGLARFLNFIVKHPVLKDDQLVEMFLTEQMEIAVWRRTNSPDLEEEYLKRQVTPEMERRIPEDLDKRLDKVVKKLDDTVEHYRNMCNIMERIARRQEGMAIDYMRYRLALNSLIEKEKGCYIEDCYNCSQVVQGLEHVSSHFQTTSTIMENASAATLESVLENLKRQRDLLVSFRETFERKDRLAVNTIDSLNTRIISNTARLTQLSDNDPEVEKLNASIQKDQEDIKHQRMRKTFMRYCLFSELTLFHKSSTFISHLYQNFVNDQIKYSQQLYENWKALSPKVYDMPVEANGFS
ncbi:3740_t:CDS:10 [Dentiscutata erythropus]|uniref:Sorting nexin MVP1 n=1 Tax=Dentiscutata erythropus TaxID=1348616 RepID=A0A9N9BS39_9GLOM|nr:3740_t:CDS:10 [Dentiscutata erythropus]